MAGPFASRARRSSAARRRRACSWLCPRFPTHGAANQSRRSRGAVEAQSRRSRGAVEAQSRRSRGAIHLKGLPLQCCASVARTVAVLFSFSGHTTESSGCPCMYVLNRATITDASLDFRYIPTEVNVQTIRETCRFRRSRHRHHRRLPQFPFCRLRWRRYHYRNHRRLRRLSKKAKVPRSPAKSREVPRSLAQSREVPRSPAKSRAIPRSPAKSCLLLRIYLVGIQESSRALTGRRMNSATTTRYMPPPFPPSVFLRLVHPWCERATDVVRRRRQRRSSRTCSAPPAHAPPRRFRVGGIVPF